MTASLQGGWVTVPYDGPDMALVEIGFGDENWVPAFLDYDLDGVRVAKVRPPADLNFNLPVNLRVSGQESAQGYIRRR